MEINESLASAISALIQGVEIGQQKGSYDLNSAGQLNQAVIISRQAIQAFLEETQRLANEVQSANVPEQPNQEQASTVKKLSPKK
jgi:hypothetical protein